MDKDKSRNVDSVNNLMFTLESSDAELSMENLRRVVDGMKLVAGHRYRVPLRDLATHIFPYLVDPSLSRNPETVDLTFHALTLTGRGMIYFQEFFDYLSKQPLTPSQLSMYVYECGRHGLRCKHFLDFAVKTHTPTFDRMNAEELLRCFKGICKFSTDYPQFVKSHIGRIPMSRLSPEDALIVMRVTKQVGNTRSFMQLVQCTDFTSARFDLPHQFNALYLLKRTRAFRLRPQDQTVVEKTARELVEHVTGAGRSTLANALLTTDITDALDAMASMKISNSQLLDDLMSILVERVAEIKYSPICGLWQAVSDSLGHLGFFHAPWMRIVEEIASSEFNLRGFAAFQLVFFTSGLGRLNFYSPSIFRAISNVVAGDVSSINDPDMLATLLFPMERAAFHCPDLVNAVLDQACVIAGKTRDPGRSSWRGSLSVVYAAVSLGVHPNARLDRLDARVDRLVKYLFSHKLDFAQYLNNQDYVRLKRLVVVGAMDQSLFPDVVVRSPQYSLWPSPRHHAVNVDRARRSFTETIPSTHELGDFSLPDGTIVIVGELEEPMMTWKNPADETCGDRIPLETNGTRKMMIRHLNRVGKDKVLYISPHRPS